MEDVYLHIHKYRVQFHIANDGGEGQFFFNINQNTLASDKRSNRHNDTPVSAELAAVNLKLEYQMGLYTRINSIGSIVLVFYKSRMLDLYRPGQLGGGGGGC